MNKFLSCLVLTGSSLLLSACSGSSNPTVTQQMGGAKQGAPLTLSQTVTTIAGPPAGPADGTGANAHFDYPMAVTSDGTNLYVADTNANTIRKVVIATGVVTTLAGKTGQSGAADGTGPAVRFFSPSGITTDGTNLYVTDSGNLTVRKVSIATGAVTTLAGSAGSWGSNDGTSTAARFGRVWAITTDGTNVFVTDGSAIRSIVIASGTVTTLAGSADMYGSADGVGAAARFTAPQGLTTDGTYLYVADSGNRLIRRVTISTGEVTTLAGSTTSQGFPFFSGSPDGIGTAARFGYPGTITTDGTNLYVLDSAAIRKIVIATAEVTTLAGVVHGPIIVAPPPLPPATATSASTTTTTTSVVLPAPVTRLPFRAPQGMVVVGANLYVTDAGSNVIYTMEISTKTFTPLAGSQSFGSADGTTAARFNNPAGIATDGTHLYVADTYNCTIRKVAIATGEVSTLAGTAGFSGSADGMGATARFSYPNGITTDGTSLYVADSGNSTIRKVVITTGEVSTLAGVPTNWAQTDGAGTTAGFDNPQDITTDGTNLFVTDYGTIRKIVIATGAVTTLAGTPGKHGWADGTGTTATFGYQMGLTTDGTNLFIADAGNHLLRKVVIATGDVSTLAGTPGYWGAQDGTGSEAGFSLPRGITTDGTHLFVTDTSNRHIRKVVIATGKVTTVAGAAGMAGWTDGTGTTARFDTPLGITTDGVSLYVTDSRNGTIRRIN
jgi:sugar lactone lactonase YvrE